MSRYDAFRLARMLLLLLLGGIFVWLAVGKPVSRRSRVVILATLGAALLSYSNFGFFHMGWGHIHYWDAFHYFMGPKYLPELGYTRLYEAAVVAGRELGELGTVTHIRDLTTYSARGVDAIDAPAVRGRFSEKRWQAFKSDFAFFLPHLPWPGPLLDHGYNDPPPRALLLHVLLRWIPANLLTLTLLTSLDYLLIVVAYWAVRRAFGEIAAGLAFAFFALSFFARFDLIGGSILRWDWIAALLIGLAAFARGSGATAGVLLGYAVLARVFPILFLVPPAMKWIQARLRRSGHETLASCLCLAAGLIVVVTLGIAATEATRGLIPEFFARMRLHNAVPSINRVGLGSLLTVHAALDTALWDEGGPRVLQDAMVAARPAAYVLPLVSTLYLLVAVPLIRRASSLESVMYAVPLVFFALSPTGYYYSFLVLLVLLPWQTGQPDNVRLLGMGVLTFNMAVSYAFEHISGEWLTLFYQASIQMVLFFVLWLGFEYARLGVRAPTAVTAAHLPSGLFTPDREGPKRPSRRPEASG